MTLQEAESFYTENDPRGEYVLVVEGAVSTVSDTPTLEDCLDRIQQLRASGASLKDDAKQVSRESGIPRNTLYEAALSQN